MLTWGAARPPIGPTRNCPTAHNNPICKNKKSQTTATNRSRSRRRRHSTHPLAACIRSFAQLAIHSKWSHKQNHQRKSHWWNQSNTTKMRTRCSLKLKLTTSISQSSSSWSNQAIINISNDNVSLHSLLASAKLWPIILSLSTDPSYCSSFHDLLRSII